MRSALRASSSGFRRGPMSGVVLLRYVHLLVMPWVRAENAAWGWVFAIVARRVIPPSHSVVFASTCALTNSCEPTAAPR